MHTVVDLLAVFFSAPTNIKKIQTHTHISHVERDCLQSYRGAQQQPNERNSMGVATNIEKEKQTFDRERNERYKKSSRALA